ncbi:MAG: DUF4252 domain-containing protein [Saprospiraceae bacterium]|nr:DUF4252 domain-containing protein [Saprospiraceae bacterium]
MKILLFSIAITLLSCSLVHAQQPATEFYRQNKHLKGVRNVKIPGWLVWFGSGIAYDMIKDEDAKVALKLARKVGKMRFMIAEEENPIPTASVSNFVSESRRSGYSDLIYIRDEGTTVNIMGKIKKNDKFRDLVIMVSEEDEFVFFHMKSNIRMKDLSDLLNHFMTDFPINDQTREKKRAEKQKRKNKNIPRA